MTGGHKLIRQDADPIFAGHVGKKLDVLVIGGGITGAGIAWDASCRGMSVGLVEMNDFASGTSSRSTKLIHGGLRYLKQGEIGLVREVGSERALLHRSAPHLVEPIPMLLPIYKKALMVILPARSDCICTTGWQESNAANGARCSGAREP